MKEFHREHDDSLSISSAVHQAIGAASMLWSERPRGEFDTTEARAISDALLNEIRKNQSAAEAQLRDIKLALIKQRSDGNLATLQKIQSIVWPDDQATTSESTGE